MVRFLITSRKSAFPSHVLLERRGAVGIIKYGFRDLMDSASTRI